MQGQDGVTALESVPAQALENGGGVTDTILHERREWHTRLLEKDSFVRSCFAHNHTMRLSLPQAKCAPPVDVVRMQPYKNTTFSSTHGRATLHPLGFQCRTAAAGGSRRPGSTRVLPHHSPREPPEQEEATRAAIMGQWCSQRMDQPVAADDAPVLRSTTTPKKEDVTDGMDGGVVVLNEAIPLALAC